MAEEKDRTTPAAPQTPLEDKPQEAAAPQKKTVKTSRPLSRGQQRRRQRSVFQYIAILFAAAFVLLLFTFLMEKRKNDLVLQQNEEQISDLQQSVSATQTLENMYNENLSLKDQVSQLEEQVAQLESQLEEMQDSLAGLTAQQESLTRAMDLFWQIDEAYVRGRYSLCRELMEQMEDTSSGSSLVQSLPQESTTDNDRFSPYDRYQEIKEALS